MTRNNGNIILTFQINLFNIQRGKKLGLNNALTAQTMVKITLVQFDTQPYNISYQKFNNNQVWGNI